jgi:predicted RNase H-like nuclease (RuvC/YqgF family)
MKLLSKLIRKEKEEKMTLEERVVELEKLIKKLNGRVAKIRDLEEDSLSMTTTLRNHDEDITRIKASIDSLNSK